MTERQITVDSAAEALLTLLAEHGIDYAFGNAGTDFPSLIEAFAKAAAGGAKAPQPIAVPHENLAIAMAHGVYAVTGRPQAVMLHVNVGTANAICGLLNAAKDNVPMLVIAGRTPITEAGDRASRSVYIHWAQEMFDQAGMVREIVKWDYELRTADQVEEVVDRAMVLAMTEPRGPVYLTLPREVIAAGAGSFAYRSPGRRAPAVTPAPDRGGLGTLADWLAEARRPLLITASIGRDPGAVEVLGSFAKRWSVPVVSYRPRYLALPSDHPAHLGYEPGEGLEDADLVIVLECDVPWIPKLHALPDDARVAHVGVDPQYVRYPMRSFQSDLALTGDGAAALADLNDEFDRRGAGESAAAHARAQRLGAMRQSYSDRIAGLRAEAGAGRLTPGFVVDTLNRLKRADDILVTETNLPLALLDLTGPGSYFANSPAGGLGWGLGASIGIKLGAPGRRVIAIVGDGSYMFGNPTPAHFICAAHALPVLTIILNNRMWAAVRRATLSLYPDGAAAAANRAPLTYLEPAPDYERVVEASGGLGLRVESPQELEPALVRAFEAVERDKRQAVVNVLTEYADAQAIQDASR